MPRLVQPLKTGFNIFMMDNEEGNVIQQLATEAGKSASSMISCGATVQTATAVYEDIFEKQLDSLFNAQNIEGDLKINGLLMGKQIIARTISIKHPLPSAYEEMAPSSAVLPVAEMLSASAFSYSAAPAPPARMP